MKTAKAYYTGTHRYSFRSGEQAEITGVRMVKPEHGKDWRACFVIKYPDGKTDLCPVGDYEHYELGNKKR